MSTCVNSCTVETTRTTRVNLHGVSDLRPGSCVPKLSPLGRRHWQRWAAADGGDTANCGHGAEATTVNWWCLLWLCLAHVLMLQKLAHVMVAVISLVVERACAIARIPNCLQQQLTISAGVISLEFQWFLGARGEGKL